MNLKEKLALYISEAQDVEANAKAEDRDMTNEEFTKFEDILAKADIVKADIAIEEKKAEASSRLASLSNDLKAVKPAKSIEAGKVSNVSVVKENIQDDPMCGFKNPQDFFKEVIKATKAKSVSHPGLKYLAAAGGDEQLGSSDPFGGFLLPKEMSPNLLQTSYEGDIASGMTTMIPMGSKTISLNARVDKNHSTSVTGGLTVSRTAETAAGASSRMEFEQVVLTANKLVGVAYITDELMADSPQSVASLLSMGFADEFTSTLNAERLNGSGVGEYEGINNSPAMVSVTGNGGADTIVFQDVLDMRSRCWGYQNAVWLANHDTLPQLAQIAQLFGSGATQYGVPMFQPSLREDVPDMLMGRPILFSEELETLGDAGDFILVNWTQYLEGIRSGVERAESMHVRFLNHENTFRFSVRNDGRSWWNSALTPKNSATTLSPFIRLAARA